MLQPVHRESTGAEPQELPYRLELRAEAAAEPRLLALCRDATLGFAIYYAALREHLEGEVRLACGERVIAASHPSRS